jgi:hypothetical protein
METRNNRAQVSTERCGIPSLSEPPAAVGGAEIAIALGIPVYRISLPIAFEEERFMAETVITLRLNQQQLELLDRTIAQGVAPDRVSLVRLALREYAAARKSSETPR